MKTAIVAILIGMIIIVIAFMLMRVIQGKVKDTASTQKNNPIINKNTNNESSNGNNNNEAVSKTDSQQVVNNTSDWKSFTKSDNINFNTEYVDSIFTVTNIKNYVKIVDSDNNLLVKTVLTGSLSGFIGTYDLEIPYSKGSHLLEGNSFKVKVQLGKYNNKVVVGEIKY